MSWSKVAWCAKCLEPRPYRRQDSSKLPEQERHGAPRKVSACMVCGSRVFPRQKMGNVPTRSKHTDRLFQSKHEANREPTLLAMQNAGRISDLKYQVPFDLEVYGSEAVRELLNALEAAGFGRGGDAIGRAMGAVSRSAQKIARYYADFTYVMDGRLVVEDPKGFAKSEYRMKKRLMVACHNIEIIEPKAGGVEQWARGAGVRGRGTGSRLRGGR